MLDFLKFVIFIFKICYFYFLSVLSLGCCSGFSLVADSGGYSVVVVCGLLTAMASLAVEHEL